MEAMSCSLPCVAYNCFGMKEIIQHKKNGYLAKPYSVDDFDKGIKYVLSNKKKLSAHTSVNFYNNFNINKINSKYKNFFKDII